MLTPHSFAWKTEFPWKTEDDDVFGDDLFGDDLLGDDGVEPEIDRRTSHADRYAHLDGGVSAAAPSEGAPASVPFALTDSNTSYTGAGVKVGVMSDSFNLEGGAASDAAEGLLPPLSDIDVLKEGPSGGADEGRAMMQIVHDVAPGASFDFYTAYDGEADYAAGIEALANDGCKVIVEDVAYLDDAMFQDGPIGEAIEKVEAEGVTVLGAAGNEAEDGYEAAWAPISGSFDGVTLTNAESFGGSLTQSFASADGDLALQVDEPAGSTAATFEAFIFEDGEKVGSATFSQSTILDANGSNLQLAVEQISGAAPTTLREVGFDDWTIGDANSGTVFGAEQAPGLISVGAADVDDTPAYGVAPAVNEGFSSSGAGSELLFSDAGVRLATPDAFDGVTLTGVDGATTSVFDPFYGTSAAAPSVAGVVAQMLQANPGLTPAEVKQILDATATPPTSAEVGGAGLVDADGAIADALAACYLQGAGIATPEGDRAIETLAVGDYVLTGSGAARPIKWIGVRGYARRFAEANPQLWPIRFAAGALAPGVPCRDLYVSARHSMALDGVLIPAERLVNGGAIARRGIAGDVVYWHLELETHDLIYAEGALSETFVDDNSRCLFHNAGSYAEMYPDEARKPAEFCLARVEEGRQVERERARLRRRGCAGPGLRLNPRR